MPDPDIFNVSSEKNGLTILALHHLAHDSVFSGDARPHVRSHWWFSVDLRIKGSKSAKALKTLVDLETFSINGLVNLHHRSGTRCIKRRALLFCTHSSLSVSSRELQKSITLGITLNLGQRS